mmetsp:Transcript_34267/g.71336  ORF Transcript_34267/g.71336 Transcript_34267/m.71336 type:complete len:507 (-) Transcript_34267:463-1983(-)
MNLWPSVGRTFLFWGFLSASPTTTVALTSVASKLPHSIQPKPQGLHLASTASATDNNLTNNMGNDKSAAMTPTKPLKVCLVGGGNAAHALAALLPSQGWETSLYCPYQDQAVQIQRGLDQQDGYMHATFAPHNTAVRGLVKGKPLQVSKNAADVVPPADILILPLPSFTYPTVLASLKDHLRPGQILCVTPGQGGFDWFARDILGHDLLPQITLVGIMPMPFNCRIDTVGQLVHVQEFKQEYTIGVSPPSQMVRATQVVQDLLGGSVQTVGGFLECTLYPINAMIHPARLYTLWKDWQPGVVYAENPYFYQDFTAEAAATMNALNDELIRIARALQAQGVAVADIPHIFDWLACHVYQEPPDSNLQTFFQTNPAYQGFRCPMKAVEMDTPSSSSIDHDTAAPTSLTTGYIPDFTNRYFTEDINLGLVGYKGLAALAHVDDTPTMNAILLWAQGHMGLKLLDRDTRQLILSSPDLASTNAPQRFGLTTLEDLQTLYPPAAVTTTTDS